MNLRLCQENLGRTPESGTTAHSRRAADWIACVGSGPCATSRSPVRPMATAPADSGLPKASRNGEPDSPAAVPHGPPHGRAEGHPDANGWAAYADQLLGILLDRASVLTGYVTHALGAGLVTLATSELLGPGSSRSTWARQGAAKLHDPAASTRTR